LGGNVIGCTEAIVPVTIGWAVADGAGLCAQTQGARSRKISKNDRAEHKRAMASFS
jgi:hypothetical protein